MKELLFISMCGAFVVAGFVTKDKPQKRQSCECRCDCYWRGKEDGRIEVRKADAERRAARSRGDELPEFMNSENWPENMPAVN